MALLNRLLCTMVSTVALVIATSGCHRANDGSSDTGFKALGKRSESKQVNSDEEFGWTYDQDGGYSSTTALDAQTASGSNYLNPGENGIPGYDKFMAPSAQLAQIFQSVYFGTNDDVVRGKDSFSKITELAHYLKSNPHTLVFIEGHCDKRGAAAYNLSLGARRANSVRHLLIEQGVEATRLFTITFGKERPAREGEGEEVWHWNRRVEYKIFQKN